MFYKLYSISWSILEKNIYGAQKELSIWHWKIVVSMYRIQKLMRYLIYDEPTDEHTIQPPTIKPMFPSTRNFFILYCESCMLDCPKKISTRITNFKPLSEK